MGKDRGIFERPKGSGIFWINYYVNGKQHREKVGAKGNASAKRMIVPAANYQSFATPRR
jgi:hypothetical protein